jgi:hypothetical protein
LIERMGEQIDVMRSITERQDEASKQLGDVIEQAAPVPAPAAAPAPSAGGPGATPPAPTRP